jgi:hypothetical protein
VSGAVAKGRPWGRPARGPADVEVVGGDADLAATASERPASRVAFRPSPSSDLARALGLTGAESGMAEVPVDALRLGGATGMAVNAVVLGTPPDRLRWTSRSVPVEVSVDGRTRFSGRAASVLVASGQYLRGADLVPRGHPGDGRAEVQVYELPPRERRAMRRRLPQGAHVPHPRIHELVGRRVDVRAGRPVALEVDGVRWQDVAELEVELVPAALWVLV